MENVEGQFEIIADDPYEFTVGFGAHEEPTGEIGRRIVADPQIAPIVFGEGLRVEDIRLICILWPNGSVRSAQFRGIARQRDTKGVIVNESQYLLHPIMNLDLPRGYEPVITPAGEGNGAYIQLRRDKKP